MKMELLQPRAITFLAILAAVLHSQVDMVASFLPTCPSINNHNRHHHHHHFHVKQKEWNNPRIIAKRQDFALWISSSSSSSSSSPASQKEKAGGTRVVYQRVVKAPVESKGHSNPQFIGYLVEYLQDHFSLPSRLPMVYESVFDEEGTANDENNSKSIQAWDSPMSPSPEATRMDLEVVAIYTEEDNKERNNIPSMAMVVVRKAGAGPSSRMPSPMMQGLFADSEKRILQALDRGLDDFMAGKIKLEGMSDTDEKPRISRKQAQDDMIEEFLENASAGHPSVSKNDNDINDSQRTDKNEPAIMDADFSRVTGSSNSKPESSPANDTVSDRKSPSPKEVPSPGMDQENSISSSHEDYAIQAAKQAAKAAAKKNINKKKTPDFAVAAAQKAAENQRQMKKNQNPEKSSTKTSQTLSTSEASVKGARKQVPSNSAVPSVDSHKKAFRTTFSTPEEFKKRYKSKTKTSATAAKKKQKSSASSKQAKANVKMEKDNQPADKETFDPSSKTTAKSVTKASKRKVNLADASEDRKVADTATDKKSSKEESNVSNKKNATVQSTRPTPTDEEIMKTSQEVMEEIAAQGIDMTPEELLDDIMNYGEKLDKENAVGSGFVSGAFEKAKELLKEQKKQREARLAKKVVDQMKPEMESNSANNGGPELKYKETSTEEDELKSMFEAGERLAEGRIASPNTETATSELKQNYMTEEDEKEVDELIAGEKSISSHARILDDELAELEVRINRSPGEESDGPAKNPLFDIFSGPEVYNPNVDPETAVNWPGAMPGSKAIEGKRLPKELNEALKQANFASEIISEMKEKENNGKKSYHIGNRELSEQEVDNLRKVVNEAVEIGIIQDPLVLLSEKSRLQMVVDELWSQPEERFREILENYKDLLLSENFVTLIKDRLQTMADRDLDALRQSANDDVDSNPLEEQHAREREILGQLVTYAQLLLKEARALGAELEAQQLEVIRSICKVAMDPSHRTEEETAAALTDAVRDMRPLFDDMFVSYLKYAVAEEEGRLAREGLLDDPEHTKWLFVLKIVQQGVYAEIAKGINRYLEHVWYVLRMETAIERRMLLSKLIDVMPTMDVRPFVRVVDNIVGSLGEAAKGEFDGGYTLGEMTNKLMQLHRDMKDLLPPERIDDMARDADEWAAKQKERLRKQRKLSMQRLQAARETEHLDDEIESLGKRGEMERFD